MRLAMAKRTGKARGVSAADTSTGADCEPVYEYDMSQGVEDGYLAACQIDKFDLFHENKQVNERVSGVAQADLTGKLLVDAEAAWARLQVSCLGRDADGIRGIRDTVRSIPIPTSSLTQAWTI
jgi:hypothetical protein